MGGWVLVGWCWLPRCVTCLLRLFSHLFAFASAQVDASHVGIGAKLGDYQGNVPGKGTAPVLLVTCGCHHV